ncbi:histidine phosphatase family protein [Dactylosporangium matsuzakiense]|uniref:Phosphoglycerate mutase n=1 Tax=Dactylosporangium matsuzakiense TaxID=53360 RepID=A0A9W6KH21_9ACTN|nr:histidine phosphatase family protein [Dactylosporangium matsuzakiense]GLK99363.1 phosphoglycerate mutase [Dactylosporangium matsuzakiense]
MGRTQLYLVRHGKQDPASGHGPDGGLSRLGSEQADRLGRRLRTTPFAAVHHSPLARAVQTAEVVAHHLPQVPRHACDFITDRTPVPSAAQRSRYPSRWHAWLDGVPHDERDEDAVALQAAVDHFGVSGDNDRRELLITHNFVIGWFVRHVLDAPQWRWIGLNQDNCAITIVQWESGRPPALVSFNDTGHL